MTNLSVKQQNRQSIFKFISDNEAASRQDIAYGLKLSLQTVITNLDYLTEAGLISNSDTMKSTGGRKAVTYCINGSAKMAIGLYLTEHHINSVCVNLNGKVIYSKKYRINLQPDSSVYLAEIGKIVDEIRIVAGLSEENILGVGIALPALLSADNEAVILGVSELFEGMTRRKISKYISYKTCLVHDSYAAIFAETWKSEQEENAFYIGLNNHISGGIVIRGQIYTGSGNKSGEIGHLSLYPDSEKVCYCGKHGCFETACAMTNLTKYTNGDLDLFFDLVAAGNSELLSVWEEYLDHLAHAISIVRLLFDSTVIVGGYVGARIGNYMNELCRRVDNYGFFDEKSVNFLKQCKYTVEDVAAGAALMYIDEFINNI